jgi:hypothetical protein
MLLYHGTREGNVAQILKEGLLPRGRTEAESNWKIESNPRAIYLTTDYAGFFAARACKEKDERWALVEVDTELLTQSLLAPDEDWLEQDSRGSVTGLPTDTMDSMEERTAWFQSRIEQVMGILGLGWRESLEGLGNCSYYARIPPEAITRVSLVDMTKCRSIALTVTDVTISIPNHQILGRRNQRVIEGLMGDRFLRLADLLPMGEAMLFAYPEKQREELMKPLNLEEAIEVITVKG